MAKTRTLDERFREAVVAVDAGDVLTLGQLTVRDPELVRARLEKPGRWLRKKVGGAVDGFFARPYLLWFVAEDPVRQDRVPDNVTDVMREIIDGVRQHAPDTLQEQLDYCVSLVAWSWVAARCKRQLAMIDTLADAGASLVGGPDNALVNAHVEAAEHMLARGAPLNFAVALCLGRWADVDRMAPDTTASQRQSAFVMAALRGKPASVQRILELGVDLNAPSAELYSHGTPLHHAVSSGSIEKVRILLDAGARLDATDSAYGGTPLGWAEYALEDTKGEKREAFAEIARMLKAEARRRT